MIYEGKPVVVQSINESGMAVVKFANRRDPLIVRVDALNHVEQLNEGFLGMAAIGPTYRDKTDYGFVKLTGLDPEDIGLRLYEADDEDVEQDDQEEPTDNGSNVRSDGHTGKKEVDELPTPSDTIAPSTTILGGRRWCTLSIHRPGRSARAARFSGRVNHGGPILVVRRCLKTRWIDEPVDQPGDTSRHQ